jgi:hypothetical protein
MMILIFFIIARSGSIGYKIHSRDSLFMFIIIMLLILNTIIFIINKYLSHIAIIINNRFFTFIIVIFINNYLIFTA